MSGVPCTLVGPTAAVVAACAADRDAALASAAACDSRKEAVAMADRRGRTERPSERGIAESIEWDAFGSVAPGASIAALIRDWRERPPPCAGRHSTQHTVDRNPGARDADLCFPPAHPPTR